MQICSRPSPSGNSHLYQLGRHGVSPCFDLCTNYICIRIYQRSFRQIPLSLLQHLSPTTEAALVAHIAESQRKLSVMRRTGSSAPAAAPKAATPAPGGGPLKYCYKHGYLRSEERYSSLRRPAPSRHGPQQPP